MTRGGFKRFHQVHETVNHAINRLDPERVLELGAPGDEYDIEIREISRKLHRRIRNKKSVDKAWLAATTNETWVDWFDQTCACANTFAVEVIKELKRQKLIESA